MRLVNLSPRVHLERDVLDADAVVLVSAAIGRSQSESPRIGASVADDGVRFSRSEVDDLLGSPVGRIPPGYLPAKRAEQAEVETRATARRR